MIRLAFVAAMSVSMASMAQSQSLVWTWDDGSSGMNQGWSVNSVYTESGVAGPSFSDTIGVTDGSHSAYYEPSPTNTFQWGFQTGNWNPSWAAFSAALASENSSLLSLDMTLVGPAYTLDPETNEPNQAVSAGMWLWHGGGNNSVPGTLVLQPDGQTITATFDAADYFGSQGSDWSQLRFWINLSGGYDPTAYYVDNFRVGSLTGLTGDLNGDGFVGQDDLNIVLGAWGTNVTPGDPLAGDPSGDGFVGQDDLNDILSGWGQGTPPSGLSLIPEPASAALLALGGLAMLRRRR